YELASEFFGIPVPDEDDEKTGALTDKKLTALMLEVGFVDMTTEPVEMPIPLADASALWDWMSPRGLGDAVRSLPDERAEEFRDRFLVGAEAMNTGAGIVLDFRATLHKGQTAVPS